MAVEFGIFDHIEAGRGPQPRSSTTAASRSCSARRRGLLRLPPRRASWARALHVTTAAVFLAALARETTRLKLIPTVVCLPLHHPVRVFEDLAMLDVLSHGARAGRRQGHHPWEHLQFGHPPEEASARSAEILAMLVKGWETGIISSEGSSFYEFAELQLPFDRIQHPYRRCGAPATSRTRAGEVTTSSSHRHHAGDARTLRRAARGEPGQPGHLNPHVDDPWIAQCQGVVIADTDEEAEAIARRAWTTYGKTLQPTHANPGAPADGGSRLGQPARQADDESGSDRVGIARSGDRRSRARLLRRARCAWGRELLHADAPVRRYDRRRGDRTLEGFIDSVIPAVREAEIAAASA